MLLPVTVDPGIAFGLALACDVDQALYDSPQDDKPPWNNDPIELRRTVKTLAQTNDLVGIRVEALPLVRPYGPSTRSPMTTPLVTLIAFSIVNCNGQSVCGPRLKHKCEGFNYLNECHVIPPLDAVILFDDSGSITSENFETMIRFIKNLTAMFLDTRAQVAVAKFSTRVSAVFHFENFAVNRDPDQLMKDVTQAQGHTYTPSAIRFVLEEMFSEKVGMRSNSQKLLLVITDGKSNDPKEEFKNVIPKANERGITRFAIGLGSYFGAELCVVGVSELLAVGAPLYHAHGVGGEVRICPLNTTIQELNCSVILRGVVGNEFGRFGTSLAAIQDLNGDGFKELAVGAPQEEKGKGAIYIFLGQSGGLRTEYSQRVSGASVGGGLQYFGVALHSAGDLTSDALTDVVVGSRAVAAFHRTIGSQPVMCLPITVTVDPPIIDQKFFHCSAPLGLNTPVATVTICVTVKKIVMGDIQGHLDSMVSVALELELDPWARAPRLLFVPRSASFLWTFTSNLSSISPVCTTQYIGIPECISDYHEVPLSGKMKVTTEVIPGTGGLRPVLSPDCWPAFTKMGSGLHVRIMSSAFLSFDTERYIQYPSDDSHQLSIVTELEFPSQALTVLIASLSVIFGLIAMTIIFVLLYKVSVHNT
ncbi:integrin alpha-X-like protein [Labeo rohita]|uniref:Integrin alpha-X-like protein n=1 Tax=Labeo rohita TaxID=84645 RepID=A0A498MQU3_LABRO|nr:integrin alpha-X-like protein [Labeo rohita]